MITILILYMTCITIITSLSCLYGLLFRFTFFNVCCAAASISAFSIKMLAVSFKLVNPAIPTWRLHFWSPLRLRWLRIASILATLNQVVGAVYLERVLQERSNKVEVLLMREDRIFLFVFGGRDATYADNELAYRNVRS